MDFKYERTAGHAGTSRKHSQLQCVTSGLLALGMNMHLGRFGFELRKVFLSAYLGHASSKSCLSSHVARITKHLNTVEHP